MNNSRSIRSVSDSLEKNQHNLDQGKKIIGRPGRRLCGPGENEEDKDKEEDEKDD